MQVTQVAADDETPVRPPRVLLVGAGIRGEIYGHWIAEHPHRARVVAVAEPHSGRRAAAAATHGLPSSAVFADWRDVAKGPRVADAVIITTQDADHVEPAVAFAEAGYAILLEKPIAPTEKECRRVIEAVRRGGVVFGACHVLRYAPYTRALREVLAEGRIGEIVSVDHVEPVGFAHYAHSYARGNWRREDESAPMLLAKSCHDMDWLQYIVGRPVRAVSSFGSLSFFVPGNRPAQAATRCSDCVLQQSCAYSAVRIYGEHLAAGDVWPLNVLTPDPTEESVAEALRTGPYGRCVWACDNDVVDHQVVALEFDGGATATFTMTAFTTGRPRETRIFGTMGEIYCDASIIRVTDFRTRETRTIEVPERADASDPLLAGHSGGDAALMDAFVTAVATRDPNWMDAGAIEALAAHELVFAAERARREGRVVTVGS